MLVLTRRLMEKLYIGPDICVTVVRVEGGQVRLGIDAPREIPVVRGELRREPARTPAQPAENIAPERVRTPPASVPGSGSQCREPSR